MRMTGSDGRIRVFPLPRSVLFSVFVMAAYASAKAGQPTKKLLRQPGGEHAVVVDASRFDSLQAAIDALPTDGGMVTIPPGRIEIAGPIILSQGDVTLRGAGTGTHIVNTNEEGKPALMIQPTQGAKTKQNPRGSLWRVTVSDLRITGNPKSGPGIHANLIDELLICRVAAEHNGADGILLDHCYEDPRITDCLITYNAGTGLNFLGCHDIIVSANQFEENQDALHCIDGYNLTMTGNNIDDHLRDGILIENTYGSVVAGNMIEECNRHAIVLDRECYGDTISANVIAHHQGEGVRLLNVKDITVSANTFVLLAQAAVHVTSQASQITITGNGFCKYPFDPTKRHKLQPGCGIELDGTRDVTISGNTFTGIKKSAISARGEGNQRISITGNTILNPSQGEPGKHAGLYLENLTDSIIANNIITDDQENRTMKRAIEFAGACGSNIMLGNNISGNVGDAPDVPGQNNQVGMNIVREKPIK